MYIYNFFYCKMTLNMTHYTSQNLAYLSCARPKIYIFIFGLFFLNLSIYTSNKPWFAKKNCFISYLSYLMTVYNISIFSSQNVLIIQTLAILCFVAFSSFVWLVKNKGSWGDGYKFKGTNSAIFDSLFLWVCVNS